MEYEKPSMLVMQIKVEDVVCSSPPIGEGTGDGGDIF